MPQQIRQYTCISSFFFVFFLKLPWNFVMHSQIKQLPEWENKINFFFYPILGVADFGAYFYESLIVFTIFFKKIFFFFIVVVCYISLIVIWCGTYLNIECNWILWSLKWDQTWSLRLFALTAYSINITFYIDNLYKIWRLT